jgi:YHS domain-containing protein
MRIRCDNCGKPFEKDDAVVYELEEGEIYYFCSDECYETSEYFEPEETEEERAGPTSTAT